MNKSVLTLLLSTALASPACAYTAYISNEKGNSITVIDTDKLEAVATVKVGRRPRGIELNKEGTELYICAGDDDAIQVLDTKTLKLTGKLPSGPDPELLALSPDGKTIYVSNENDNLVTLIDVKREGQIGDIPVGVEPEGMAVSPTAKTARQHVGNDEHGAFHRHADQADRREYTRRCATAFCRIQEGRLRALGVLRSRRHRRGYRSDQEGIEAEDQLRDSRNVERGDPAHRHFHHQGRQARLRCARPGEPRRCLDAETKKIEKYLLVGQRVWHLAFTPDEKYLLTANGVSNDISVIDAANLKVVKSIPVGSFPWGVVVAPK